MKDVGGRFEPTARTGVRRHRERGAYDRETVHAILDEGLVCHLACVVDGQPHVLPTAYGRAGEVLYLHGAAGNHLLKAACAGGDVSVVVTLLDGMVVARTTFNHSMNYRSVVVFGPASEVTEPEEKAAALNVIVEHLLPGRSAETPAITPSELRQTRVIRLPIEEASAKVRSGPPANDDDGPGGEVWSGVIPLRTASGPVEAEPDNFPATPEPRGLRQPARWSGA